MVNYSQFNESDDAGNKPSLKRIILAFGKVLMCEKDILCKITRYLNAGVPQVDWCPFRDCFRKSVCAVMYLMFQSISFLSPDEDYGRGKETTKKIRAPPREIKHKKSKNSQEERQESVFFQLCCILRKYIIRIKLFYMN